MKKAAVLGVDFGLTNIHSTVISIENGALMAEAEQQYTWDCQENNCSEINPDRLWNIAQTVVANVLKKYDPEYAELCAMVLSCFGEALLAVDENGKATYPLMGSTDTRATVEAESIARDIPLHSREIGGNIAPASTPSMILWVKNNKPEAFKKAAGFYSLQQYILIRLGLDPLNDYTMASRKMMLDIQKKIWSGTLCDYLGVLPSQLGEIVPSNTVVGEVDYFGAVALPNRLKVVIGAHDACSSALGLGITPGNEKLLLGNNSGTWNLMNMYLDKFANAAEMAPQLTPGSGPIANSYYFQAAGAVGPMFDWVVATLCGGRTMAEVSKMATYDATCNVRLIQDPMTGDGRFVGLSLGNSIFDIFTGIIESITFPMRGMLEQFENLSGKRFNAMRISAGGAKADNWVQLKANVLNISMERVANLQASSLGAAMNAAVGIGYFSDYNQAIEQLVRVDRVFAPDPKMVKLYAERREAFMSYTVKGSCFFV